MTFFNDDETATDYADILRKGKASGGGGGGGDTFPLSSMTDLEAIPEVDYLFPGLVQHNTLVVLYAPPGSLKSFLALDMGLRLSYGMPWLGDTLTPEGVLYCAAEGSSGMRKRIRGWRRFHGMKSPSKNFHMMPEPLNLLDDAAVDKFIRTARLLILPRAGSAPVKLTVLDTLARCIPGGDENKPVDMGKAIAAADRIKAALGCTTLLLHHSGKDLTRGARGHSSLKGAADTELSCERAGNDLKLQVCKQKDDADSYAICFDVKIVDIDCPDAAGKARSTLVLVPSGKENAAVRVAADAVLIANVMRDGETRIPSDEIIRRLQAAGEVIHLNGAGRDRLAAVCGDFDSRDARSSIGMMRLARTATKWSARLLVSDVPPDLRRKPSD